MHWIIRNRTGRSSWNNFTLTLILVSLGVACVAALGESNPIDNDSPVSPRGVITAANSAVPSAPVSASTENKSPVAKSANALATLPADARGPISAALGNDDPAYWVHRNAEGFHGENPRERLSVDFTIQRAEFRTGHVHWSLATRAYGYGAALHSVRTVAPLAAANRVEYRRDGMTEWYENGPLGLEQGFTLAHRPGKSNGQPLTLALDLRGDLSAALAASDKKSTALELRGHDGKPALRYTGLEARDATGRELPSWLEIKGDRLLVRVQDQGARYPVVVDPWVQQAELTASDGASGDEFGYSVAVSGSTAVVGAPTHTVGSNTQEGAAYVFVQSGTTWSQQAELTASDGAANDGFGWSVAVSGGTALVGNPGHTVGSNQSQGTAYVFVQSGTTWNQQAELTASDGGQFYEFGNSVALQGSTAIVGSPGYADGSNTDQGAVYVFVQSGTTWNQQAELTASDGTQSDNFGTSVALSGNTFVAGAPNHQVGSNASQGAAYVFVQSGTSWSQQAELTSSDGAANDEFSYSVAISGGTAVVGAPQHTVSSNQQQGAAYLFTQSGTSWSQQMELTASDGAAGDFLGFSTGIADGAAVVGAPLHPIGSSLGAQYVFVPSGNTWSQQSELSASGAGGLGWSSAFDGASSVAGAIVSTVGSTSDQGSAYVFAAPTTTVTLTPGSETWGNEAVNTTSAAKMVTLKNTGTSTLYIGAITPSAGFAISANTCTVTLATNSTCKVSVAFAPTQLGEQTGTLTINDAITANPQQTVALSGTGVAQTTLTPIDISFATTKVGKTSTQIVTLKNNLPTTLTGISYTITSPFGISPLSTCGTTLDAKKSCVFKVTFTPTGTGPATGMLTVTDSANNSPQTVSMEGDAE